MSEQFSEVLAEVLELEPAEIRDDLTPDDVDLWDSFTHVTLVVAIEEAFNVMLDPNEATKIRSVGDIRGILRKRGIDV